MEYEKLLDEAYSKVKKVENSKDRLEVPKAQGHFTGKKTIVTNFAQISSHIRRAPSKIPIKRTSNIRTN